LGGRSCIKEEDKDLNYWKKNCEEDYLHTPISVLRYITKLEEAVNNSVLDDVSQQSELFEIIADRLEKELPFELETIKRETLIKIISNCG
jgi:hypothetical protein